MIVQAPSESKASQKFEEKAPAASSIIEEEPEDDSSKQDAQKAKELGNAAYKAKKFEEAIKYYDEAIKLDDSDISFLTNRLALLTA